MERGGGREGGGGGGGGILSREKWVKNHDFYKIKSHISEIFKNSVVMKQTYKFSDN